jgi:hypothetical protein
MPTSLPGLAARYERRALRESCFGIAHYLCDRLEVRNSSTVSSAARHGARSPRTRAARFARACGSWWPESTSSARGRTTPRDSVLNRSRFAALRSPTAKVQKILNPHLPNGVAADAGGSTSFGSKQAADRRDPGEPRRPGSSVRYRRGSQVHRRGFGFVLGRSFGCVLGRGKAERVNRSTSRRLRLIAGGVVACWRPSRGRWEAAASVVLVGEFEPVICQSADPVYIDVVTIRSRRRGRGASACPG